MALTDLTTPKATATIPASLTGGSPAATTPQAQKLNGLAAGAKAPTPATPPLADSVADKVKQLTSQDSPLMQQARTDGLKVANRRGLLNSSMAAGASQEAMLRAAQPIAAQDASQAFQKNMQTADQTWQSGEKQLDRDQETSLSDKQIASTEGLAQKQRDLEEKLQNNTITADEASQLRQIKSTEGLASQQRNLDLLMQTNQITSAEGMQVKQIASTEGIAAAERKLQDIMQQRSIASQERMAAADRALQAGMQDKSIKSSEKQATWQIGSQQAMQYNDIQNQQKMQGKEIGYQTSERALDRTLQDKLAGMNLKSADRNAAAQFVTNMETMFQDSYSSIMGNPSLDAAQRTAQITSAKALRDKQMGLVEQMYGVDLKW